MQNHEKTLIHLLTTSFLLLAILCSFKASTVYAATNKPATPKNFKGTVTIENYLTTCKVTWSKVNGATGYEVYVRDSIPGGDDNEWYPWHLLKDTTGTSASYSIYDGVFQLKVRAYKISGGKKVYSAYTNSISVLGGEGIITLKEPKQNISISKSSLTMATNTTYTLSIKGTDKKAKWSSSNSKIAKVDSKGKVTGLKAGTCTITATVDGKKYTCKLTVKDLLKYVYGDWYWFPLGDSFITYSKSNSINSMNRVYSNTRGDEVKSVFKFDYCIEDKNGNICIYSKEVFNGETIKYKDVYCKDGSFISDGMKQAGTKYGKCVGYIYNEKTKKYELNWDMPDYEYCWLKSK